DRSKLIWHLISVFQLSYADAEDVVQDVAIDCLSADSFEGKSSEFSYLKSIANHKAIDLIRQPHQ
ncbi:RNA polymerase sigma-70 region 2 domain protein, partial [Candidatus Thiomargarita nelsonii]